MIVENNKIFVSKFKPIIESYLFGRDTLRYMITLPRYPNSFITLSFQEKTLQLKLKDKQDEIMKEEDGMICLSFEKINNKNLEKSPSVYDRDLLSNLQYFTSISGFKDKVFYSYEVYGGGYNNRLYILIQQSTAIGVFTATATITDENEDLSLKINSNDTEINSNTTKINNTLITNTLYFNNIIGNALSIEGNRISGASQHNFYEIGCNQFSDSVLFKQLTYHVQYDSQEKCYIPKDFPHFYFNTSVEVCIVVNAHTHGYRYININNEQLSGDSPIIYKDNLLDLVIHIDKQKKNITKIFSNNNQEVYSITYKYNQAEQSYYILSSSDDIYLIDQDDIKIEKGSSIDKTVQLLDNIYKFNIAREDNRLSIKLIESSVEDYNQDFNSFSILPFIFKIQSNEEIIDINAQLKLSKLHTKTFSSSEEVDKNYIYIDTSGELKCALRGSHLDKEKVTILFEFDDPE